MLDNSDIDSMLKIIYEERGLTLRDMTFSNAREMIEIPEKDPATFEIGQRVKHSIMGIGTVVEIDAAKGAHIIQFDRMETTRAISFKAKLEAVEE